MSDLSKNLPTIISSKQEIVSTWVAFSVVNEIFAKYLISTELFANHFATRILDYFIGVVDGTREPGQCPAVSVMLMFFHHKRISLDDVFLICDNFKKSLLLNLQKHNELTPESIEAVFLLYGANFAGVIREYLAESYTSAQAKQESKPVAPATSSQKDLAPPAINKSTAKPEFELSEDDLALIDELDDDISQFIIKYYKGQILEKEIGDLISCIERLSGRLLFIGAKKLSGAFTDFATHLREHLPQILVMLDQLLYLFEAMQNDIQIWAQTLSAKNSVEGIEDSMIANFKQIEATIAEDGEGGGGGLEFF